MKKIITKNYKYLIGLTIGIFISITVVYASSYFGTGSDLNYDNSESGLISTNVQDALEELHKTKATGCPIGYTCEEKPTYEYPVDVFTGDTTTRSIGSAMSGTTYNNPEDAMSAVATAFGISSYPACLGHKLNGTTIQESYVVFTITQAMVSANASSYPGMTAGTYYLRGGVDDSSVYSNNIDVLKAAFGASNPGCSGLNGSSSSASCSVSGLYADVNSVGDVYASGGDHRICDVYNDGVSICSE